MENEEQLSELNNNTRFTLKPSFKKFLSKFNLVQLFSSLSSSNSNRTINDSSIELLHSTPKLSPVLISKKPTTSNKNIEEIDSDNLMKRLEEYKSEISKLFLTTQHSHLDTNNCDVSSSINNVNLKDEKFNSYNNFEDCPICFRTYDEILKSSFSPKIISIKIGCKHKICGQCFHDWTIQQMKKKLHLGKCPVCLYGKIEDEEINSLLTIKELDKYFEIQQLIQFGDSINDDQEIAASMIEDLSIHGFVQCPGCGIAIQREGQLDDLKCRCGYRFCYVCQQSLGKGTFFKLLFHQHICKGERSPVFFIY